MLTVPHHDHENQLFVIAFLPSVLGMLYVSPILQLAIRGLPELYWHQFSEPYLKSKKASHHKY